MELRSVKKTVFSLRFTPEKVDHVPGAKLNAQLKWRNFLLQLNRDRLQLELCRFLTI